MDVTQEDYAMTGQSRLHELERLRCLTVQPGRKEGRRQEQAA
jgi:hypothetical protein